MAVTWRLIFFSTLFFFKIPWLFSCETEIEATAIISVLSILINCSYFQLNALKPDIHRFSGSASLMALAVFMCDPNRAYSSHLDFIIHLRLFT